MFTFLLWNNIEHLPVPGTPVCRGLCCREAPSPPFHIRQVVWMLSSAPGPCCQVVESNQGPEMFGQVGSLILIADGFTYVCVGGALVLFLFVLNLLQNKIIDTFLEALFLANSLESSLSMQGTTKATLVLPAPWSSRSEHSPPRCTFQAPQTLTSLCANPGMGMELEA